MSSNNIALSNVATKEPVVFMCASSDQMLCKAVFVALKSSYPNRRFIDGAMVSVTPDAELVAFEEVYSEQIKLLGQLKYKNGRRDWISFSVLASVRSDKIGDLEIYALQLINKNKIPL